jgi:hypothetical protein
METRVSFSIFTADPLDAWGQATGEIDVARKPKTRSDVTAPLLPQELLASPVEVADVWEGAEGLTFVAFNVMGKDTSAAQKIGEWLEREWGLFAEAYGEE